jgi:hypothetical protein
MRAEDDYGRRRAKRDRWWSRKVKGAKPTEQPEDRKEIEAFLKTREGVEAYLEPRTLDQPLSVVLVAKDGEWKRFRLRDDKFIRQFSRSKGLPVYEVGNVGYPKRMRDYRRPES